MRSLTRLVVSADKFVINVDGSVSFVTAPTLRSARIDEQLQFLGAGYVDFK